MNDVKEMLVLDKSSRKKSKQKRLVRSISQGVALIIFGFALSALFAVLRDLSIVPQGFVKVSLLVFFILGMIRMLSPFITGENFLPQKKVASLDPEAATGELTGTSYSGKSLPEAQYQPPINFASKTYDTAEMVMPASVTEDTTKRLKNQMEQE